MTEKEDSEYIDIEALNEPFVANDIEWRVQRAGITNANPWARVMAYITNRAIMMRLDEVCQPFNWQNEFSKGPEGGVICTISIWDERNQRWVAKSDGAENTHVESVKGGLSSAMKRAGSQWGIGRYLYNLDSCFAVCSMNKPSNMQGWNEASVETFRNSKEWVKLYWQEPPLPDWAVRKGVLDDDIVNIFMDCKTNQDLQKIWGTLTSEQKVDYEAIKDQAKELLNDQAK